MPSQLCRWYIHVQCENYEPLGEERDEWLSSAQQNPDDDSTWQTWLPSEQQATLQTRLRDALEHNDFSPTPILNLPIAIPQIAQAADKDRSRELLIESLGFSIMSRNAHQIHKICGQLYDMGVDTTSLHPFHLATSFLDGSKSCCDVVATLADNITGSKVHDTYINEHGHTVLDHLMIAIIKSHTSATPIVVDNSFKDVPRFVGEEIDICGRWDADSACVRQLHVNGSPSIPPSWKHKFCHTSTQTICHCIMTMFDCMPNPLLLETPSGLYLRRCFEVDCGKKLQLSPLHSLVMTAYQLATQGRDDEDLFGILACALCLVSVGFDPSVRADISVDALLSLPSLIECDHEELTAADLAEHILEKRVTWNWNTKIKTGWSVLTGVLRRCEIAHIEGERHKNYTLEQSDANTFMGCTEPGRTLYNRHRNKKNHPLCFTIQKDLGTLWSSIQAEVLSYRRLDDEGPWLSSNFSLLTLQEQLNDGETLMVGYVADDLLKAHCACHSFGTYGPPLLEDAVDPNLANLDVYGRATYGL